MKALLVVGLIVLVGLCFTSAWSIPNYQAIFEEDLKEYSTSNEFLQSWKEGLRNDLNINVDHGLFAYEPLEELLDNGDVTVIGQITLTFYGFRDSNKVTVIIVRIVAGLLSKEDGKGIASKVLDQDFKIIMGWNGQDV